MNKIGSLIYLEVDGSQAKYKFKISDFDRDPDSEANMSKINQLSVENLNLVFFFLNK